MMIPDIKNKLISALVDSSKPLYQERWGGRTVVEGKKGIKFALTHKKMGEAEIVKRLSQEAFTGSEVQTLLKLQPSKKHTRILDTFLANLRSNNSDRILARESFEYHMAKTLLQGPNTFDNIELAKKYVDILLKQKEIGKDQKIEVLENLIKLLAERGDQKAVQKYLEIWIQQKDLKVKFNSEDVNPKILKVLRPSLEKLPNVEDGGAVKLTEIYRTPGKVEKDEITQIHKKHIESLTESDVEKLYSQAEKDLLEGNHYEAAKGFYNIANYHLIQKNEREERSALIRAYQTLSIIFPDESKVTIKGGKTVSQDITYVSDVDTMTTPEIAADAVKLLNLAVTKLNIKRL